MPSESYQTREGTVAHLAPAPEPPSEEPGGSTAVTDYDSDGIRWPGSRLLRLIVAVIAVAVIAVAADLMGTRTSTPSLAVTSAGPAVIQSEPGGVGTASVPVGQQVAISTGALSVSTPIQVTAVDVTPGTKVLAGQPILSVDPTPLRANETLYSTELAGAQQSLATAQQSLAQLPGNPAYLTQRVSLQSQVQTDSSQVLLLSQALAVARGNSSTITAPINGTVSTVSVTPGETVTSQQILVQILDLSTLSVTASIPLTDLSIVSPGQKVTVTFPDLPNVTLQGTLIAVSPNTSGGGQYGTVIVTAANSADAPVPLGVQALVSIVAPRSAAVSVPRLAVVNSSTSPAVYVVRGGRVTRVSVTLGAEDANRVQIVSGVSAGQQVALTGTQTVTDGEKVRVVTSSP